MDRVQPRSRNMRLLTLGAVLVALTAGYLLMVRQFNVAELPSERHFGAIDQVVPAGEIYLEPVSIDALTTPCRFAPMCRPSISESKSAHSASDRDLTLLVSHDNTVEEIKLAAGDHIASSTFEVDLNEGSVTHYPLDSYVARLDVQLLDGKSSLRLPARITMWEGVLGYGLHTTRQPGPDPDDVQLTTTITRSGAFALFALCAYAAMLVLGCCATCGRVLTFTDVRRAGGDVDRRSRRDHFCPPRIAQRAPGRAAAWRLADMWVFLWTELAVVFALALSVFKWAVAGPPSAAGPGLMALHGSHLFPDRYHVGLG